MIVAMNPTAELNEFRPPLTFQQGCPKCRKIRAQALLVNGLSRKGMGQTTSGTISQAAGGAATLTGATAGLLTAAGVIQAVPVAGQIIGAALAITAVVASFFKGCGSSCVLTSDEANQVGNLMSQNLNQYMAAPVSAATQQEALANFDQLWAGLVAYCSQPSMSSAGQRCISDRQQGSCAYKTSPGGWQQQNGTWTYVSPGANGSGSTCWNYFVGMRDPIANDPRVAAAAASSPAASLAAPLAAIANTFSGLNLQSLLVPAGLVVGGLVLASVLGDM